MKNKINMFFRICSLPFVSMAFSFAYIIYNGFLGIYYKMIWNGAICAYSLLLFTVRSIIIYSMRKAYADNEQERKRCKRVALLTHMIMAMINVALILPIATMIKGDRPYNLGLIPSIAMAAYTTYRIVNYIIHSGSASDVNLFAKEFRTINLIDICVAVLTLQNTMIIANDGKVAGAMKEVSIGSSTVVWFFILALTVHSFMGIKKYNDEYFEKCK